MTKLSKEQLKVISDKVRRCLALANCAAGNENEAANAANIARKILAKYSLTMSDLNDEEKSDIVRNVANTTKGLKRWEAGIGGILQNWVPVVSVIYHKYNNVTQKRYKELTFIGEEADVIVAIELFKYIRKFIKTNSNKSYKGQPSAKRSYAYGVVNRLRERFLELKKEPEVEFDGERYALMVINKKQRIDEELKNEQLKYKKVRSVNVNEVAYQQGRLDADLIGLNSRIGSSMPSKQIPVLV